MKRNITAFLTIGLIGVISHFIYDWTGENVLVGLVFPVNESIWEHLKLIFFPSIIYFTAEWLLLKEKPENYIPASICAIYSGMMTVLTLYYVITGITGKNLDFINILIYFTAVIIVLSKQNKRLLEQTYFSGTVTILLCFLFVVTAVLFIVWSYNPPNIAIFIPPTY